MAEVVAILALSGLLLAVLFAWLYSEREHAKERRALLDRVQAPGAVQAAMYQDAFVDLPEVPPPPDPFTEPTPQASDLALAALLGEDQ